ncbi:MAG: proline racemase family protein [Planctomycetaceae bacterium]|nr:hydroxyproline-2-epimerase [Planctomycetaceae bacterium]
MSEPIRVIDSHTGGEPTRIVVSGVPDLRGGSVLDQMHVFNGELDHFRSAIVNEPRGWDAMVGALLVPSEHPDCDYGVIFFNNVGSLWMCGHGTIGLGVTLKYLGVAGLGTQKVESPVGVIEFELLDDHTVELTNVPSYRYRKDVEINVPGYGLAHGDIAWGGNWFFLMKDHRQQLELGNVRQLTEYCTSVVHSLSAQGIVGEDGKPIDHVELFSQTDNPSADARNFVLCPGLQYDRSPCGTGTSAKVACLLADEVIAPGEVWRQESIVGSIFEASAVWNEDQSRCIPTIRGTAYITADAQMILQDNDNLRFGIGKSESLQ